MVITTTTTTTTRKRAYGPNLIESLTGRVLVLGKKHVGKSATIVRYTTGRYIGAYGSSTSDWLYRHWLGLDERKRVSTTIELLEQKDIPFESGANLFNSPVKGQRDDQHALTTSKLNNNINPGDDQDKSVSSTSGSISALAPTLNDDNDNDNDNDMENINHREQQQRSTSATKYRDQDDAKWSLSWRVAMDLERDEKVDLLNRIQWAHAYVVIYAVDDFESYEKAIRYLNLIAQTNYGSIYQHHHQQNQHSTSATTRTSGSRNNSTDSTATLSADSRPTSTTSGNNTQTQAQIAQNLQEHMHKSNSSSNISNNSSSLSTGSVKDLFLQTRKPILLVANKSDLVANGGRKVNTSEGRNLALRHQAMFAELSVAQSQTEIETALNYLFESIDSQTLISSPLHKQHLTLNYQNQNSQQDLMANFKQYGNMETSTNTNKLNPQNTVKTLNGNLINGLQKHRQRQQQEQQHHHLQLHDEYDSEQDDVFIIQDSHNPLISFESSNQFASKGVPEISFDAKNAIQNLITQPSSGANIKPPNGLMNHQQQQQQQPLAATRSPSLSTSSNGSRYKNLKSSFKRASMAIVSSRTLLNSSNSNHNNNNASVNHNNIHQLQSTDYLSSSTTPTSATNLSKSSNSINSLTNQQKQQQQQQNISLNTFIQQASTIRQQPHLAMPVTAAPRVATTAAPQGAVPLEDNAADDKNNKLQSNTNPNESNDATTTHARPIENAGSEIMARAAPINTQKINASSKQASVKAGSKESLKESLKDSSAYYTVLVSERLKRTILKYKTRRKTVAFEPSSVANGGGGGGKSRDHFGLEESLQELDDPLFEAAPSSIVKWSLDSTNSLCNAGLDCKTGSSNGQRVSVAGNGNPKKANSGKQTTASDGGTKKATSNLDRSSSALSKGDKLYYRSIFGVQRPLANNKQQQQQQQVLMKQNAEYICSGQQQQQQQQVQRPGSSSSSSMMSVQSVCSLSMSPTQLQQDTAHINRTSAASDQRSASSSDADQDLATSPMSISASNIVAQQQQQQTPAKRQSTVRNVMNSLTRRPVNKQNSAANPKLPTKQQDQSKTLQQQNSTMRKPVYAGLFGGSNAYSAPVMKQTIEAIPINVAHVETIGNKNTFGAQLQAGFCQQL